MSSFRCISDFGKSSTDLLGYLLPAPKRPCTKLKIFDGIDITIAPVKAIASDIKIRRQLDKANILVDSTKKSNQAI